MSVQWLEAGVFTRQHRSTQNIDNYCTVGRHFLYVYPLSTHMTKSFGSSPSIFAYCKWSKTGGGWTRIWRKTVLQQNVMCE